MEIKKLESEDLPAIATLLRNYWKERGMDYSQEWTLNYLTNGHKTEIKKDQSFVLKEQDKIVGIIAVVIYEGDVAEIRDLVVKKEYRRKGYGKKLLEYIMDFAKRNQVRKIYALIFQPYRFFLEKVGFELEGYLKDHFKEGEHLLLMSQFFREKEEKQVDLKQKLEDVKKVQEIEEETSGRLQKLRLR
ncbi:GNAT family N-acetyltransferase [Candidatus Woesearchaeota archaeon]|nr:GNAT family N-acetyltransferase [Candidatus Woesearchaeota archaeon]